MKTEFLFCCYLFLLLLATIFLLQTLSQEQQLWAEISHPTGEGKILLYQRPRDRHQTPEILVYSQRRTSRSTQYIGRLALPEDDRTQITQDHTWTEEGILRLSLYCDPCMIEQRHYDIHVGEQPHIIAH